MDDLTLMEDNRSLRQSLQTQNQTIANLLQRLETSGPSALSLTPLAEAVANPAAPQAIAQVNPGITSTLKIKNPDVWSGTRTTLPRFLASCRSKFMIEEYSELEKIVFTASYLGGAPADWWDTLFQKYEESQAKGIDPPLEFTSFAIFSRSLTTSYGDPDLKGTMERRLYALRQTSSVATYAAEFQSIAGYLTPGWSDEPFIFLYKLHLKENIKDALVHEKPYPKTFLEMVAATIRLDNREYERTQEQRLAAPPSSQPPLSSTNGYAQE
jgi:Retrotransposon gag protein